MEEQADKLKELLKQINKKKRIMKKKQKWLMHNMNFNIILWNKGGSGWNKGWGGLGVEGEGGRVVGVETEAKDTEIQKFQPGSKNWTLSQNPPQRAPNIVERASGSGSAGPVWRHTWYIKFQQ